jgi:hypothetical protein
VSVVHAAPSSQEYAVPEQAPPEQASLYVHALLSLQAALFGTWAHAPPWQTSSVQGLASVAHALPSLAGVFTQAFACSSHVPALHVSATDEQSLAGPAHTPA